MRCPACHHENPEGAKFCGECGAKLERLCTHCGTKNPLTNKFCHQCGHPFPSSVQRPPQITPSFSAVPAGERRQATVMFSDLTGYTAMNEVLDPEEVEALMTHLKNEAVRIVEHHGGIVNQFVGDEVLALFGIPTAHEDDPVRAVRAALELHILVRQLSPQVEGHLRQPLRMHTGIHTGLIVITQRDDREGRYGIIGDTVNTGARLKAQAEADTILVSPEVQQLIAPYFETKPLSPLVMKGKASPLTPYQVMGETQIQSRFEAAAHRGLTPYTGRERELTILHTCLDKVRAGQGQFVSVMGEAGVGKSRLLYEFRQTLITQKILVLQGRCQSYGNVSSFLPFLEVLRQRLDLREEDSSAELLQKAMANITAINPVLERYLPLYLSLLSIPHTLPLPSPLEGQDLQHILHEALAALFCLQTQQQPTVLMLEDWHWADEASVAFLHYLLRIIAPHPVMVIVTYRPEYTPHWGNLSYQTTLNLHPLDVLQTEQLIQAVLHVDHLPSGLGSLIQERTGGNPFFIEEVCHSLQETGIIVSQKRQAVLTQQLDTLVLPDTVQAIIRTRIDQLDAATRETVRLASVIGRTFRQRILERLYTGQIPLAHTLETLKALEMIQQTQVLPEAEYLFKHVLIQEVAYETLLLQRRRALHGQVGTALEEFYPDRLDEQGNLLYHHFRLAEQWEKAVHYGRQAAEKATKLCQFREAVALLEQVQDSLQRLPPDHAMQETLIDILLQQERLYETLGWRERQQAIIDQLLGLLRATEDLVRLAEVYVRQGELFTQLSRFAEAEHSLSQALTLRQTLSDKAGESSVLRSMGFLRWHQGKYEESRAYSEAALAIDRQYGDATACALDLTNLGAVLRNLGDYEQALRYLEEALQLYEMMHNTSKIGPVLYNIANVYRHLGAHDQALEYYQRAYDLHVHNRNLLGQTFTLTAIAHIYWEQGKTQESIRLYKDVVQMTREIQYGQGLVHALRTLGELLLVLKAPQEALPYLLESTTVFAELGEPENEAAIWEKIAAIYEQSLEDYPKALSAWDKARTCWKQVSNPSGELQALQQMGKLARHHLHDLDQALHYFQEALLLAKEQGEYEKQGALLNTIGIIEWHQTAYLDALQHYEEALQIYRSLGKTAQVGLMLNSIGVTLRNLGRYDEALIRLQEAVTMTRQAGQPLLEGHSFAILGDVYRDRGDYQQALHHYQLSLDIRQEIGDRRGEGWMLHALATVYSSQANYLQAQRCIAAALALAEACTDARLREACLQLQDQLQRVEEDMPGSQNHQEKGG